MGLYMVDWRAIGYPPGGSGGGGWAIPWVSPVTPFGLPMVVLEPRTHAKARKERKHTKIMVVLYSLGLRLLPALSLSHMGETAIGKVYVPQPHS